MSGINLWAGASSVVTTLSIAAAAHAGAARPAAGGGAAPSLPPPSPLVIGAPLEITVENVRNAKGHVHVDVCTKDTFMSEEDCAVSAVVPATPGRTVVVIPRLPAGRYAVQAYQDENDNGHVDRNKLGIPTESVGFSRDPVLILGPPRWRAVAIDQTATGSQIHLKLKTFP
jgi:uncharacterized protein (DUF2141 family)